MAETKQRTFHYDQSVEKRAVGGLFWWKTNYVYKNPGDNMALFQTLLSAEDRTIEVVDATKDKYHWPWASKWQATPPKEGHLVISELTQMVPVIESRRLDFIKCVQTYGSKVSTNLMTGEPFRHVELFGLYDRKYLFCRPAANHYYMLAIDGKH